MGDIQSAVNKLLGEENVQLIHPHRPGEPSKYLFYFVTDPSEISTFNDIISKVDIIALARIVKGTGIANFENSNPQLYPASEMDTAITDAEMRMAALKAKKE